MITDERLAQMKPHAIAAPTSELGQLVVEAERSRELLTRLDETIRRMQRERAYSDADCILSELSGLMQEYRS